MNIRCQCEWCESWTHTRTTLDEWKKTMYDYKDKNPEGYKHINEEWLYNRHKEHEKIWKELDNKRSVFENYSKEDLLKMCDDLLGCSGSFDDSQEVHSLCLAVKNLLK